MAASPNSDPASPVRHVLPFAAGSDDTGDEMSVVSGSAVVRSSMSMSLDLGSSGATERYVAELIDCS